MATRTFKSNGGGDNTVLNVTLIDDFISCFNPDIGSSGATAHVSGNFIFTGANQFLASELNHPGIIQCGGNSDNILVGYGHLDDGGSASTPVQSSRGTLFMGNDFDITMLCRLTYPTGADADGDWTLESAGSVDQINIRITNAGNLIYTIIENGNTHTATSAVACPASTVWFKLRFVYAAGIASVYLDTTLVVSQAATFGATGSGAILTIAADDVDLSIDTDYVITNYQATR